MKLESAFVFNQIFNFPVPLEKDYQYFPRFSTLQFLLRRAINIFLVSRFSTFQFLLRRTIIIFYQYFPRFSTLQFLLRRAINIFLVSRFSTFQFRLRRTIIIFYQYFPRFSTFQFLLRSTINIFLDFQNFQLSSSSGEGLSINIYISKIGANISQKIRNRLEWF